MAFLRKHTLLSPYCMHVITSFIYFVQIYELNIRMLAFILPCSSLPLKANGCFMYIQALYSDTLYSADRLRSYFMVLRRNNHYFHKQD